MTPDEAHFRNRHSLRDLGRSAAKFCA
jgi:hypothetical protein